MVIRQLLVVDAEQMQDRGVKIMPGDRPLDRLPADLIGAPKRDARLQSGTGHPATEAVAIVITPGTDLISRRLGKQRDESKLAK